MLVDTRTDLWSLGAVIFYLLAGRKPFAEAQTDEFFIADAIRNSTPAPALQEVIEEVGAVTEEVAEFVANALEKDRARRFQSAAEMAASLEQKLAAGANGGADGAQQRFDFFISYRVWCDAGFAEALFKAVSAPNAVLSRTNTTGSISSLGDNGEHYGMEENSISGNGGAVRVYLDKVRLLDGQRFDIGFICGLASSTVFGPLLSGSCLKSFVELGHVSSHRARFRVYAFACDRLMYQ